MNKPSFDNVVDRLKEHLQDYVKIHKEHAELVEALELAVKIIPRAWIPAATVTYAEWDSAFDKIDAILEKVK